MYGQNQRASAAQVMDPSHQSGKESVKMIQSLATGLLYLMIQYLCRIGLVLTTDCLKLILLCYSRNFTCICFLHHTISLKMVECCLNYTAVFFFFFIIKY